MFHADTARYIALISYFLLNLAVTVSSKAILHFPCPYLLTAFHSTATAIGCRAIRTSKQPVERLSTLVRCGLVLLSLLYNLNIAVSNLSLALVPLPLHQNIRALAPVLTVCLFLVARTFSCTMFTRTYTLKVYLSLIPIVLGVFVASPGLRICEGCAGSLEGSSEAREKELVGILWTFLGTVLAVLKTIATNNFLHDTCVALSPVDMLTILSPLAASQAFAMAGWTGEASQILSVMTISNSWLVPAFCFNAALAFALNVASFETNKRCGPLTMAVAANLKQVLVLAIPLDGVYPSNAVILGTFITTSGSVWYAWAGNKERRVISDSEYETTASSRQTYLDYKRNSRISPCPLPGPRTSVSCQGIRTGATSVETSLQQQGRGRADSFQHV